MSARWRGVTHHTQPTHDPATQHLMLAPSSLLTSSSPLLKSLKLRALFFSLTSGTLELLNTYVFEWARVINRHTRDALQISSAPPRTRSMRHKERRVARSATEKSSQFVAWALPSLRA